MRSILLIAALSSTSCYHLSRPSTPTKRSSKITAELRAPADARSVEALIDQTKDSRAVVVLHFCDPSAFASPEPTSSWDSPSSWDATPSSWTGQTTLSGAMVERVANEFSSSQLYGGAPLIVLQIDADEAPGDVICAQRGVASFPTLQIWSAGLCEEVVAGDLEQKLLSLGVASRTKKIDTSIGTATFESDLGTGKPSATAVDEIDFTGGRALGTTRGGQRGIPKQSRTTRDFFPGLGLDEKPGDNMGKDGTPGSGPRKKRTDRPLGYDD